MNVESLIFAYLAVCVAMIGFNIVCIFVFRHNAKRLDRHSDDLGDEVRRQIERSQIDDAHIRTMRHHLRRTGNLMALDRTLESLREQYPQEVLRYMRALAPVFVELVGVYCAKDRLQTAYLPYVIAKYRVLEGDKVDIVIATMLELAADPSLYCRENALHALYSIGDCESVVRALRIVDGSGLYHHAKLITDGLLQFTGDARLLAGALFEKLDQFSPQMQVALLNYVRFSSGEYGEQMLRIMLAPGRDDEVRYSCLRYFGRYPYQPAYDHLMGYLTNDDPASWEYAAIAATSLASYPGERTVEALKDRLGSRSWHVRYNAAQSLERLGLGYPALIDVIEGRDRYASEMVRYRLDQKRIRERADQRAERQADQKPDRQMGAAS